MQDIKIEKKSRTLKKKEAQDLQRLGEKLVDLSSDQLENIDMPIELLNAVKFAYTTKKHGARRRQMQYIGTLMRKINTEPIKKAIEEIELGEYSKALNFKKIEKMRDELIAGDNNLIEAILKKWPQTERSRLFQLVRNARKEASNSKTGKSYRSLFRYLMEISTLE